MPIMSTHTENIYISKSVDGRKLCQCSIDMTGDGCDENHSDDDDDLW